MKIKRKEWEAMRTTVANLCDWRRHDQSDIQSVRGLVESNFNRLGESPESLRIRLDGVEKETRTLLAMWADNTYAPTIDGPDRPIDVVQIENDHRVLMEIQVEYSNLVRETIVPIASALADMRGQLDSLQEYHSAVLREMQGQIDSLRSQLAYANTLIEGQGLESDSGLAEQFDMLYHRQTVMAENLGIPFPETALKPIVEAMKADPDLEALLDEEEAIARQRGVEAIRDSPLFPEPHEDERDFSTEGEPLCLRSDSDGWICYMRHGHDGYHEFERRRISRDRGVDFP